jgi:NAD(P)-dependent dehydrogenase (short-subunit alcohol dehydrogenase family)
VDNCGRLVADALRQMGRLEILANNTGIQTHVGFVDSLGGRIRPSHAGQPARTLRARPRVCPASARQRARRADHQQQLGARGASLPNSTDYCDSKGGLMNHPEKIAALLGNIPAQHLGQPRDVGGAVTFLASDDTSYMTGTTFFDGGLLWNYREQ